MPNRIPTPGVPTPAVRKSPMAQPSAKPSSTPKRPMVGNDKDFNKKYGSKSWNNGYTN
jgi:hypothetical protein